eukprot:COSAG05_NODE_5128_length_1257_cov_40.241796_1_plen_80_part_00
MDKQAFTSVSHKAIDRALAAAGASAKVRALVRCVYDMAEAQVRMQNGLGQEAMSDPFRIRTATRDGTTRRNTATTESQR